MIRGSVHWADLVPRSGSEQRGRRPVVIVSHDGFNRVRAWRSLIVVPLTTSEVQMRRGPSAIYLRASRTGLPLDSVVLCHQVTTLDRGKIGARIVALDLETIALIEVGLLHAMDLSRSAHAA